MLWGKKGLIFRPNGVHPKLLSHAANPLPILLEDDKYRIFYSGRDIENRSSVGFVDIDIVKRKILYTHTEPVFEYGPEGSFYSHGVSIGNCYQIDGNRYILFMGWKISEGEHWHGEIGRLRLNDDFSLTLDHDKPFMALNWIDPISLSYPWVMPDGSGGYHMWYGSTIEWHSNNNEMLHVINYASSPNGENWKRQGLALPYELGKVQAFSRPTVIGNNADGFEMWFSCRGGKGDKYRIGYATSHDGITWTLALDKAGIDVSESGWDSIMIEYPYVFEHNKKRYLLYNGNEYGKNGFGLAVLV